MTVTAPLATMRAITGTRETTDNQTIVAWANEIGRAFPEMSAYAHRMKDAHETAWCGFCMGYVMAINGIRPPYDPHDDTKSFMWAAAWREFGGAVDHAEPGDVMVLNHHVTMNDGEAGDYYVGHGGNQSDQVKKSNYLKSSVLAIRRPPPAVDHAIAAPIAPSSKRFVGITATVFADASVAYRDVKPGWNDRPGVALPYRFKGPRPTVRVWHEDRSVDCEICDVGPWEIDDPYWETGTRPHAESGTDRKGRHTNLAGIDLTPAAASAIALNGKGVVAWQFITQDKLMTDDTAPAPAPVQLPAPAAPVAQIDLLRLLTWLSQNPGEFQRIKDLFGLLHGGPGPQPAPTPTVEAAPAPAAPPQPSKLGFGTGILATIGSLIGIQQGAIAVPFADGSSIWSLLSVVAPIALSFFGAGGGVAGILLKALPALGSVLAAKK